MPDLPKPFTSAELRQFRSDLHQTPRSMAGLLGVRLPRYYRWEQKGSVPVLVTLAAHFLATQDLAPPPRRKSLSAWDKFPAGTRLGRLVVRRLLSPGGGLNLRIVVRCDCGVVKTWQTSMLNRCRQCSSSCALSKEPMPSDTPPTPKTGSGEDWEAGL